MFFSSYILWQNIDVFNPTSSFAFLLGVLIPAEFWKFSKYRQTVRFINEKLIDLNRVQGVNFSQIRHTKEKAEECMQ